MRDVKQKPRNNAPKVMEKARDVGAEMKKVYYRAKTKADIDNDQYDSPAEYAEAELSDMTHDGIDTTRKVIRKTGKKVEQKVRKQIEKRIDKHEKKLEQKLEEKLKKEIEQGEEPQPERESNHRKERSRGKDRPEKEQKSRRRELKRRPEGEKSKKPKTEKVPRKTETVKTKQPAHSKPAYSEAKPQVKPGHTSASPRLAPKNTAATVKKAPAKTVKGSSQSVKTVEQSAKVSTKATAKAAQETARVTEKAAQAAKVAAEKAAQAAKVAAEAAVKAAKALAKFIAEAAKAAAEAIKELVAAIIAGGWVSVIVIAVIAVVALLVCSAFGVFATEDMSGCKPMSEIIAEINDEYHQRMENDACAVDIGEYDALMVSYVGDGDGDAPVNNWNDVIAVFAVYCSTNPDDAMDVIQLTDISIDYIRRIFYEMNWYDLTTDGRYDEEEEMWIKTVYVHQHSMTYQEAADHFGFNDYQREILYEMMKPEYCTYYARLMGINVSGDANINEILAQLPATKGGDVVRMALTKLGAPYVLGAKGDDKFDCSGLVCWSISQVDPELGAHFWVCAADQAFYCHNHGIEVEQSELQPGDLVFWQKRDCSGCGRWNEIHHVGIYIGLGQVIEASSSKGRVVVRPLWSTESYPVYMFGRPY